MVRLNRIYTRTGDDGTTGLAAGPRRRKDDPRIEAIGAVDETNAAIGLARLSAAGDLDASLSRIQNDLFDLGAELATPPTGEPLPYETLAITAAQVAWLETEIDRLNADLPPLRSFVLPAGSQGAAHLHLARTLARRAERRMVALSAAETVAEDAMRYVNRLSDYLFVAARSENAKRDGDVLWVAGAHR